MEDDRGPRTGHPGMGPLAQHPAPTRLPRRRATSGVREHLLHSHQHPQSADGNHIRKVSIKPRAYQFAHMYTRGFDVLTWRKGATDDIEKHKFRTIEYTDADTGRTHR